MSVPRLLLSLLLVTLAAGAVAQTECRDPQKSMMVAELMFGRNIGGHLGVTESRWSRFLASEITPRFPGGLTVIDAAGQWLDPDTKKIVREPSKLVMVVLRDDAEGRGQIDAIVAAYKRRFRQQSVGVMIRPACVSFQ
jgi:hypothetical protein